MSNDGKQLEALVAFVEETLLPQGFEVRTNQRIYNDEGTQIAEFDVEVRGKIGTTSIAWLIECRDRPGSGPAPGSWIEQLVGRRTRFGFNKITAVSTTGFSEGAVEFAHVQGIELREVSALTPEAFSSWLELGQISQLERRANLENARVLLSPETPQELQDAVLKVLSGAAGSSEVLRSNKTGQTVSVNGAFLGAIESQNLFDGVEPNSKAHSVQLHVQYVADDDHFVIDTELGPVRVEAIVFSGELVVIETLVPISVSSEYRNADTGEVISQVAAFAHQVNGMRLSLELHHIGETGQTHIVMRRLPDDA
jgi:hypothetical protein